MRFRTAIHGIAPNEGERRKTRRKQDSDTRLVEGVLDVNGACEYLGIKASELKRFVKNNEIRHARFSSRCIRFKIEWLNEFVHEKERQRIVKKTAANNIIAELKRRR